MSRAFADAWVKRSKNSRFWGVRRRATAAFYQTCSPHRHRNAHRVASPSTSVGCRAVTDEIEQLEHDAVGGREPLADLPVARHRLRRRGASCSCISIVLAALRVGEQAGRLSDWQALALGVTQGFSELLPISSSGHLILVPWLADWTTSRRIRTSTRPSTSPCTSARSSPSSPTSGADVLIYLRALRQSGRRARDPHRRRAARVGIAIATVPPRSPARSARARSRTTSASRGRSHLRSRSSRSCSASPTAGRRRPR